MGRLLIFIGLFGGMLGAAEPAWWNDAVFYEVYVRAFQDSDGDGHGDLKGLISRLDYLNDGKPETSGDLGVTALWLMPIFEAQSQHGYDTLDYFKIEKDYGTLEDLKTLVAEAHKRGIRIILDLVLNHTSHLHPWFQEALGNPESPYRRYFDFRSEGPGGYWRQLPGYSGSFFGIFNATMPDLNFRNPAVGGEMEKVIAYWLRETGIDGYRLDAIKHLIEEGQETSNTPATHTWLRNFHRFYKSINPQAFTVGEVWDSVPVIASYTGDQMDVNFHFPLSSAIGESVRGGRVQALQKTLTETLQTLPAGQYAVFLRNHDMPRLIRDLGGDQAKALQAAGILLTLPGVPFLYYGEELGLSLNRKTMMWDETGPAWGFTSGRVFSNGTPEKDPALTVTAQSRDPRSLLSGYRSLIALRNQTPALRTGDLTLLNSGHPQVLVYTRRLGSQTLVVVHNLADEPVSGWVVPPGLPAGTWQSLYGPAPGWGTTLAPRSGRIFLPR